MPASRISAFEAASTLLSTAAINVATGWPRLAHNAALGPKNPHIGGDRHTGLPQMMVQKPRPDLVGKACPWRHARPLRIDHQLPRMRRPPRGCGFHRGNRGSPFATIHRNAANPQGILAQERGPDQLFFHDELRRGQGRAEQNDVKKALMLRGDQDCALRYGSAHFRP